MRRAAVIDLHTHLFPPRMFEAVWRFFEDRDWPVHHEHVESLLRTYEAHGVEHVVALSYPHRAGVARSLNSFMEDVGRRSPLFLPFGSVHVDDDTLADDVRFVLDSPVLRGFKFQPLVQRFDVNDPRLDGLYAQCVERDFPLLMHLGTAPIRNEHVGFSHFRKLMDRYPELRVCVAHMGAFEVNEFLYALDDFPKTFLDTTMINVETDLFDTTWRGDANALRRHADRICYGSDWPNVPYPYSESLASVSRFPLPDEARRALLHDNALRFLGGAEA